VKYRYLNGRYARNSIRAPTLPHPASAGLSRGCGAISLTRRGWVPVFCGFDPRQPAQARCTSVTNPAHHTPSKIPPPFSKKSPAFPLLIKIRCAKMLTKAHHPTSLTEEDNAR
jgi:hypothetical protein